MSVPWAPWLLHCTKIRAKLPPVFTLQVYSKEWGDVRYDRWRRGVCECVIRGSLAGRKHVKHFFGV